MSRHARALKTVLAAIIVVSMLLISAMVADMAVERSRQDRYVTKDAELASENARNTVTAEKYLPAIIRWHMREQVGLDDNYRESGTLDYGCTPRTKWFVTRYKCAAEGIEYRIDYDNTGRVLNFEWNHNRLGV